MVTSPEAGRRGMLHAGVPEWWLAFRRFPSRTWPLCDIQHCNMFSQVPARVREGGGEVWHPVTLEWEWKLLAHPAGHAARLGVRDGAPTGAAPACAVRLALLLDIACRKVTW